MILEKIFRNEEDALAATIQLFSGDPISWLSFCQKWKRMLLNLLSVSFRIDQEDYNWGNSQKR
jgi:hypothetical protein